MRPTTTLPTRGRAIPSRCPHPLRPSCRSDPREFALISCSLMRDPSVDVFLLPYVKVFLPSQKDEARSSIGADPHAGYYLFDPGIQFSPVLLGLSCHSRGHLIKCRGSDGNIFFNDHTITPEKAVSVQDQTHSIPAPALQFRYPANSRTPDPYSFRLRIPLKAVPVFHDTPEGLVNSTGTKNRPGNSASRCRGMPLHFAMFRCGRFADS